MADKEKDKTKGGNKEKPAAKKPEKAPKADKAAEAESTVESSSKKAAKAPPRPPADPRVKVLKKFQGRLLPRGPLRERFQVLLGRWNSSEDHGGVTVDELKGLLNDWRSHRAKPVNS